MKHAHCGLSHISHVVGLDTNGWRTTTHKYLRSYNSIKPHIRIGAEAPKPSIVLFVVPIVIILFLLFTFNE